MKLPPISFMPELEVLTLKSASPYAMEFDGTDIPERVGVNLRRSVLAKNRTGRTRFAAVLYGYDLAPLDILTAT